MTHRLQDELWIRILELGIGNHQLHHRDVCALGLLSRQFRQLCSLDLVWKQLFLVDFQEPRAVVDSISLQIPVADGAVNTWKSVYRKRYEVVKEKLLVTHRRKVHMLTSDIDEIRRQREVAKVALKAEKLKLFLTQSELENLDRASRAAVALEIWQPTAVRTEHQQVVEQIRVDSPARRNILNMELRTCRSQIHRLLTSLNAQKFKIRQKQKERDALKYSPSELLQGRRRRARRVLKETYSN